MSFFLTPRQRSQRLRPWELVEQACRNVLCRPWTLAKSVALPSLLTILLLTVQPFAANILPLLGTLTEILLYLPFALVGLGWYRAILQSGKTTTHPLLPRLSKWSLQFVALWMLACAAVDETFFLLWNMSFLLVEYTNTAHSNTGTLAVVYVSLLLGVCLLIYIVARLSMVLCGAARSQPVTPRASWRMTRGQGGQIVTAGVVLLLPLLIGVSVSTAVLADLALELQRVVALQHGLPAAFAFLVGSRFLLWNAFALIAAALTAALLASAYRQLENQAGDSNRIADCFD